MVTYSKSCDATVSVPAPAAVLFDYLDDQERLGGHMQKPSLMMLGGFMRYEFDAARGRAVGSVIRVTGRFLGLRLYLDEVVEERIPLRRKVWATRGHPHLFIIDAYRMGFEITPRPAACDLRVFIEYNVPQSWSGRILGVLFGPAYARWCVKRMADDARRSVSELQFSAQPS